MKSNASGGGWSVRELKRQIASLYYERSGLSLDKQKLSKRTQHKAQQAAPQLAIRDPYVFEFLGLKPREVMSESQLEDQLIDRLENPKRRNLVLKVWYRPPGHPLVTPIGADEHGFLFTTKFDDRPTQYYCRRRQY